MSSRLSPAHLRRLSVLLLSGCLLAGTSHARDPALAESLFIEGKKLLRSGEHARACELLAESNRQDPASGTLLALALCFEKAGRVASAWATYSDAAALAAHEHRPDRERSARERVRVLEPLLPRMRVEIPAQVRELPGLTVLRNGDVWPVAARDSAVPMDPGPVTLEVAAPGFQVWRAELQISDQPTTTQVEVPMLVASPPPQPQVAAEASLGADRELPPGQARDTPPEPCTRILSNQAQVPPAPRERSYAAEWALGGIGVAALGTSAYFGIRAGVLNSRSNRPGHCDGNLCSSQGYEERVRAGVAADMSSVLLVGGAGLLVAAGATYWFRSKAFLPRPAPVRLASAALTRGGASFTLQGHF
ncbi:MAG TPA: hypothetical protein VFQ61_14920 [Polyangiaceae bacterium]|nr:hypothetical protein [Polyangiaceae bacterium]